MPDSDAAARLAARYPEPSRRARVTMIVLLALVLGAGLTWYLAVSARLASPDVNGQIATYAVVDDQNVMVELMVSRADPRQEATCTVIASDATDQAVGEVNARIAPATDRRVTQQVTIRTYVRATNVHLKSCAPLPAPPR